MEAVLQHLDPTMDAATFDMAWQEAGGDDAARGAAFVAFLGREAALQAALSGGDDYVLAFTLPPEALAPLANLGFIEVHTIGRVLEGQGVTLRDAQGRDITPEQRGYQHFRETP